MTVGTLLAVLCVLLGFLVGVLEDKILFDALTWFIAAIAVYITLNGVGPVLIGRKGGQS